MRFHHGLALPAVVALLVLAGLAVAFEAGYRRRRAVGWPRRPWWRRCWALPSSSLSAHRCPASWEVALAAPGLPGPEEPATLRRTTLFCRVVYRFGRKGSDDCLASEGEGAAVVGCR